MLRLLRSFVRAFRARLLAPRSLLLALAPALLFAQPPPDDPNDGALLSRNSAHPEQPLSFTWFGREGRYYFIEQSENLLQPWTWFPYAVRGVGAPEGVNFNTNASAFFLRLRYSDNPASDLLVADFDDDRVPNGAELDQRTDPFRDAHDDGDALPDDWEIFHLGTAAHDDLSDTDRDGYTLAEEFTLFRDPAVPERDRAPVITTLPSGRDDLLYASFTHPYPEGVLRFTTDGSEPTALSPAFSFASADNRLTATIGFTSASTPPAGCDALDQGLAKSAASVGTPEAPWIFGWQGPLAPADFGTETVGTTPYAYVRLPLANSWSFDLSPGIYRVTLHLLPAAGQTFTLALEGQTFDAASLLAPATPGPSTLTAEVRVIDGSLTLAHLSATPAALKLTRLRVEYARSAAHSTGAPPYGTDNLPSLSAGISTVRAAVFFPDAARSPVATLAVDFASGLGASQNIYLAAVPTASFVSWSLTAADPSTFPSGYGYFWLGAGWIAPGDVFLPDPAFMIPAEGAYLASVSFGTLPGGEQEVLSYANPSLTTAVSQGKALLVPLGARRIAGSTRLAPPDAATPSAPVYYGERPTKLSFLPSLRSHSTSPTAFLSGRYVALGSGWIEQPEFVGGDRFTPDQDITSTDVYVGTVTWATTNLIFLSTDPARLKSTKRAHLGRGWIDEAVPGTFLPDFTVPSAELYIGNITDGSFTQAYLAASTTNLSSPRPLGRGWITAYNSAAAGHALVPDRTQPSRPLHFVQPSGWNFPVLNTSATSSLASLGQGWITGAKTFEPDPAQTSAPVYFGYLAADGLATHSLTRSGLHAGGARLATGRILARDRFLPDGTLETIYHAPVRTSAAGSYDFVYSNEATNPVSGLAASEMGPGRIAARDRVRMDITVPASPVYFGVVVDTNGFYTAYARTTTTFLGSRYFRVGTGHILAQRDDAGFSLLLADPPVTDLWYGRLSSNSNDSAHRIFRSASSFPAPPATPTTLAQHYFTSGGVTYYYAGRGRPLDARDFEPDTPSASAPLYQGFTSPFNASSLLALGTVPASMSSPILVGDGWAYGLDGYPVRLADPVGTSAPAFVHPRSPFADRDGDGLSGLDELLVHGTNPLKGDTDGDLVPDALEISLGRDPLGYDDPNADDDGDGLSNHLEYLYDTDPGDADGDTDNDGWSDLAEIEAGSSPTDPAETPATLDARQIVALSLSVGDWSGSHSERYRLEITELTPEGSERFVFRLAATTFGQVVRAESRAFRLGRRYLARLHWEGSNQTPPDIDWELTIAAKLSNGQTLPTHRIGPGTAATFLSGAASATRTAVAVLRDPHGLIGTVESGTIGNPAAFPHPGKAVVIDLLEPAIAAESGKVHLGFDPPNLADPVENDSPQVYWASVTQGQSNQILHVDFPSDTVAQDYEWRLIERTGATLTTTLVGNGRSKLNIAATATGTEIQEPQFGLFPVDGQQPVLLLNVMVLPQRTLSMGIYKLIDPNSLETQMEELPSIPQFLEVLNDVFHQAGVQFVSAHPVGQTEVGVQEFPYDSRKIDLLQNPLSSTIRIPGYLPDDSTGLRPPEEHDAVMHVKEIYAFWKGFLGVYQPPGPSLVAALPGHIKWFITRRGAEGYAGIDVINYPDMAPPYNRGSAGVGLFADNTRTSEQLKLTLAHETGHLFQPENGSALGATGDHDLAPHPPQVLIDNPNGQTPQTPLATWFGTTHLPAPERAIMASGYPRNPTTNTPDINGQLPWLHGRWMRHEEWDEMNTEAAKKLALSQP